MVAGQLWLLFFVQTRTVQIHLEKGSIFIIYNFLHKNETIKNNFSPNIFRTLVVLLRVFWLMLEFKLLFLCIVLPFSRFIIGLYRSLSPISIYSTEIRDIGAKKNKTVASSNEWSIRTRSGTIVHHVFPFSFMMIPVCIACGTAKLIDKIQIKKMNFTARDNFDIVCDKNGWQIAT